MKISVVIPALNEEKYIGKLLDCLVSQTFKDFEVIVSDGNSEDKTREVVLSYMDSLDISFVTSDVRSPSHQRNHGASHAKYDYLVFLDSDVTFKNDFLEKVAKFHSLNKYAGIGGFVYPDPAKLAYKFIIGVLRFYIFLSQYNPKKPFVNGAFMSLKREVFKEMGGFDEEVLVFEDCELFRKLKKVGYKIRIEPKLKLKISMRRTEKRGLLLFIYDSLVLEFSHSIKGPVKRLDKLRKKYKFGNF